MGIEIGSSAFGMIFPKKIFRNNASRGAVSSPITMCISSCLDIRPMRSAEGKSFKDEIEWLDAYLNEIGGDGPGAAVSGVIEILDQDGDFAFRLVPEVLAIKLLCVFQRADQ